MSALTVRLCRVHCRLCEEVWSSPDPVMSYRSHWNAKHRPQSMFDRVVGR